MGRCAKLWGYGWFALPSGRLNPGECYMDAARRVAKEVVGWELPPEAFA